MKHVTAITFSWAAIHFLAVYRLQCRQRPFPLIPCLYGGGRLKIPWVAKSVGSDFLLLISYSISHTTVTQSEFEGVYVCLIAYDRSPSSYIWQHSTTNSSSTVVSVMKMGNILPRLGLEPTSLAFRASVLPLQHIGFLMTPLYLHLPVQLLASEVSADYYGTNN